MIAISTILIILVNETNNICAGGCLKCDPYNRCLVSDTSNFYKITNESAVKVNLSKCKILHMEGYCLSCDKNLYIDSNTRRCVNVPSRSLIENCEIYSSDAHCMTCATNFYLKENVCLAVESLIKNCENYSENQLCLNCKKGFLLTIDHKNCVQYASDPTCAKYTLLSCKSCSKGYIRAHNTYIMNYIKRGTVIEQDALTSILGLLDQSNQASEVQEICEVESTSNCYNFNNDIGLCVKCQSGYFLDSLFNCVQFPDEPIDKCVNYSNSNVCTICANEHLLINNGCVLIDQNELIDNCITYDSSKWQIVCRKCLPDHFLKDNLCEIRINYGSNMISSCEELNFDSDTCASCNENSYLTKNGLECRFKIEYCINHDIESIINESACIECMTGYYLASNEKTPGIINKCLMGSVLNCDIYSTTIPDKCEVCSNGYFMKLDECIIHNTILDCDIYSNSQINTCQKCKTEISFNFYIQNSCQTVEKLIPNCLKLTSGSLTNPICGECYPGFYLKGNDCIVITIHNCLVMDGNICTVCSKGFALSILKTDCSVSLIYMGEQCLVLSTSQVKNVQTLSEVGCYTCKEHAIPYLYQDLYACVFTTNILQFNISRAAVDSCLKYDRNVECVQCDPSSTKPFLNTKTSPPSCVAACNTITGGPYSKITLRTSIVNSVFVGEIYQYNICFLNSNPIPNCLVYGPNLLKNGEQICILCNSNSIPVINLSSNAYSNVDPLASSIGSYIPSAFAKFPEVSCPLENTIIKMSGSTYSSLPINCRYYQRITENEYACIQCKHRYTSSINSFGYIDKCTQDISCSAVKLYNLDLIWDLLITCNRCENAEYIPFIGYSSVSINDPTFVKYEKWVPALNSENFMSPNGDFKNMFCTLNSPFTFGLKAENYGVNNNCGIGAIIVNTSGEGDNITKFGTFCAACKPGFLAVSHPKYPFVKISCKPIDDCIENSSYFNTCSKCKSEYILNYSDAVDYTTCVMILPTLIPRFKNCYAGKASKIQIDKTANRCEFCLPGYNRNVDDFCEKYSPNLCEDGQFIPSTPVSYLKWNWSLWASGGPPGCNRCGANFSAIQMNVGKTICVQSTWVANFIDNIQGETIKYIKKCKNYSADPSNLKCDVCDPKYVLSGISATEVTGKFCYPDTGLQNCRLAKSEKVCVACSSDLFGLVSGLCIKGSILKCKAYNHEYDSYSEKCTKCSYGYYVDSSSNRCLEGSVNYCLSYDDDNPFLCNACQAGYLVVNIADNKTYCYRKDATLGCDSLSLTSGDKGGIINCLTCKDAHQNILYDNEMNNNKTLCLGFNFILNCKSYDIGNILDESTFECTECEQYFYVSSNKCQSRANVSDNCLKYSIKEDKCILCDSNSYLSQNGNRCNEYPKGILGCKSYLSNSKCISCSSDRYLSNNQCLSAKNKIENCSGYSEDGVCSECKNYFILTDNVCKQSLTFNCATYISDKECATCNKGYVLEKFLDIVKCVAKFYDGCEELDINYPYPCLKCDRSYYIEDGKCKVPNIIEYCVEYLKKKKCSKCKKGYILSDYGQSCFPSETISHVVDPQCNDLVLLDTPTYLKCASGYYFLNGLCRGSCNIYGYDGCLLCNPANPSQCFICAPGFFMVRNQSCVSKDALKAYYQNRTAFGNILKISLLFILYII